MGKGSGSTRASSSGNPKGLAAAEGGFNPLQGAYQTPTRISDANIQAFTNKLRNQVSKDWKDNGNIDSYIKIPNQPLIAEYTLTHSNITDLWTERVTLRSTIDSNTEVYVTRSETTEKRPNLFVALGSSDVLKELLKKYNQNK